MELLNYKESIEIKCSYIEKSERQKQTLFDFGKMLSIGVKLSHL